MKNKEVIRLAKEAGFSDKQLASFWGVTESDVRKMRYFMDVKPWVKQVCFAMSPFIGPGYTCHKV